MFVIISKGGRHDYFQRPDLLHHHRRRGELGVSAKTIRQYIAKEIIPEPPVIQFGVRVVKHFPKKYMDIAKKRLKQYRAMKHGIELAQAFAADYDRGKTRRSRKMRIMKMIIRRIG